MLLYEEEVDRFVVKISMYPIGTGHNIGFRDIYEQREDNWKYVVQAIEYALADSSYTVCRVWEDAHSALELLFAEGMKHFVWIGKDV